MYVQTTELNYEIFYQGDLIKDFPFFIFDEHINLENVISKTEAKIEINAKLNTIIILSQTCDIQRRKNAIICPVYKMDEFSFNSDDTDSIKKRKTGYWFYLPPLDGVIEESIADFQTIYYVPRAVIDNYKKNKIVTMSDWGRHHLSWALNNYFGRPVENK